MTTGCDLALDYEMQAHVEDAASLDNRNKEVVVDVKQGSKKSDKDLKSKVAPDALDKKTVGPIRKGKTSKMSPWDDARARAEKVRAFKADLQKMKKKKEEEYRKRLEALKMEREKRIAAKTAQLASSQKTKKQLPTKLTLSSVKGTKFSDSEPGSSCPPQRSKIRAASTGSSESHKASKSNKSSNGSHLPGNRLTRSVSSLPEPWKENSDVTPDPKEEEYRKRLEALKMEREKRIAKSASWHPHENRKQLPTKLALSSVKGTKFMIEPGSSCPPQRSKIRAASTGSSESHKASKSNKSNLEPLPNMLQWKYALLRDLDKSLQDIQQQNEQHCEQEIEEIKRGIKSGNITPDASNIRFSDEVFDDQKHAIRIADEKVALAVQAYDLVDAHVQQLDQYLKKFDEELRRERESAATTGSAAQNLENNVKSTSGRGGRKKTRLAATTTASATANPTSMDLYLPVDPNEPTYCFCNQCKIEWFHFGCVGLKEQPKGKWYCSECVGMQKRRKGK
ncbi:PHD finger protein ING1 [Camellia lanceoleosa]|uniref:PHD finger protein ING1 n=1 Tax=Camellia lanceoleosa TaxID=1840588 RepID=A0ACC0GMD4_9ERIC|nr:PHD finger protein ING1 [Camellia lanceoleosa]